ncbi:MAG: SsrA-binding protein SmpB [Candidatus Kapaibacterium sp.]|nr:SsrA-binding protein SmpB [Ignavibacteriota bacterium]
MSKVDSSNGPKIKIITTNRRASYDFSLVSRFEAGIMLTGTEVKALRENKCSLQEAYIGFVKNGDELFIMNMTIPEYSMGNRENHEPTRNRKLLLHKREIKKLKDNVKEKGMTIIPLQIYFSDHLVKLEIALAKPKKNFDKRESTKKKEVERDLKRKYKV